MATKHHLKTLICKQSLLRQWTPLMAVEMSSSWSMIYLALPTHPLKFSPYLFSLFLSVDPSIHPCFLSVSQPPLLFASAFLIYENARRSFSWNWNLIYSDRQIWWYRGNSLRFIIQCEQDEGGGGRKWSAPSRGGRVTHPMTGKGCGGKGEKGKGS